ncbi:MAG: gamma-glutamylcyclotransferase [Neomegalonema sp.]|nr:gamma-glutamylcyclotransferase [Neomegalonema sp.]
MSDGAFFGYGSLVNVDTYPARRDLTRARLKDHRRVWGHLAHTRLGPTLSLSIEDAPAVEIEGVMFTPRDVEEQAWLDRREAGYAKKPLSNDILAFESAQEDSLFTYQSLSTIESRVGASILMSYVDAVMQGFIRLFGPEGAQRFVETTGGWRAPLLDDRADPIYPRAVMLTDEERALIDALLRARPEN